MAIALIACSRKKADGVARGKAKEIYDSEIFNKSYEWAKQKVGEKNIYIYYPQSIMSSSLILLRSIRSTSLITTPIIARHGPMRL